MLIPIPRVALFKHIRVFSQLTLLTLCMFLCQQALADNETTTLTRVKERGELICGVRGDFVGMSAISKSCHWQGFDVDFCRAIAVAVLGNKESVDFISLSSGARFSALINSEIDVLIRNSTWTFTRDAGMPIEFVGVSLYDGQGFIASSNLTLSSIKEVRPGTTVCVQNHTTTKTNLIAFNKKHGLKLSIITFSSSDQAVSALFSGKCKIYTGDMAELISIHNMAPIPSNYSILPEKISKELLGPSVRDNDPQWINIVRWVLYLTIEAEEKGITSQNIDSLLNSSDPSIRYILGTDPGIGSRVGLDDKWARRVLVSIGNYGEIFNRNFTAENNKAKMKRGLNRLWNKGGLMYSPPLR